MKKIYYRSLAIFLSLTISFFSIINCFNVKSNCGVIVDAYTYVRDNFADTVSAIGGAIWDTTTAIAEWEWNEFKRWLGIESEEDMQDYINGHTVGGDNTIGFDDTITNDIRNFTDDLKASDENFKYGYSSSLDASIGGLYQRSYYEDIKRIIQQNPNSICIPINFTTLRSNSSEKYESTNWNYCFKLYVCDNPWAYVYSGITNNSYTSPHSKYFSGAFYNDNWVNCFSQDNSAHVKVYTYKNSSSTTLSLTDHSYSQINTNLFTDTYYSNSVNLNNFNIGIPLTVGKIYQFPVFKTTEIMQRYSVGNLPYYNVPTNPNFSVVDGYNTITTTNLDNSISYGDVSTYVSTNSVTEYSTVVNYINNYYSSGSGGSGSGGSGSGGSGSDIDWSWLGRIGEVIGGLISALGNVVAGIIDGISSLITSLTESLPNIFGSCIEWLLPFLPQEVSALLGAMFLAIIIVGVVRLIRGK